MPTELVIVGRLRRPHGVRGELVVEPITDAPAALFAAGHRLFVGDANGDPLPDAGSLTVRDARTRPDGMLVVTFDEIAGRDEAASWAGRYLLVPQAEVEPPKPGEVWVHELVGMRVLLPSGEPVGDVVEVYELPQGLALEVRHGESTSLVPFVDAFVPEVRREARELVITPPAGLLE